MNALLLGVDGGNTKTLALVTELDGGAAGVGNAGCADIHNASSPELALDEIVGACTGALAAAGARAGDLAAAAFSLAGADWPEDFALLRRELGSRLGLRTEPEVVNDAVGALRCGTADTVGVAAVIGTYGAVAGRSARGDLFHLGFWPDSSGAFALGSEALAAVWRHMIDLGPATSLTNRALARWSCSDAGELLYAFTRIGGLSASEPGLFADAVLDEAEVCDPVAVEIVRRVGGRLGDYAHVCASRTGQLGAPFPLVLCGGVLRHPSLLLRAAIHERVPDAQPVYPEVEPVVGAVLIAADRIGARPDLERLRAAATGSAASTAPLAASGVAAPGSGDATDETA
jgi:N-acetylglucosamine kinase-like BadF-type ATPase